jgi:hypothetical protein
LFCFCLMSSSSTHHHLLSPANSHMFHPLSSRPLYLTCLDDQSPTWDAK